MLKLFQEYNDALNLAATNEQLALVEQRTREQLQQQTLELDLTKIDHVADTLELELDLWNKAGHKFPSGYPSRIAWVALRVEDEVGNVLFEQGGLDANFEVIGRDLPYEPHHDIIRNADQVQIYEMVMADANDLPTTILDNAAYPLKDNRMVPDGFTMSNSVYDTTLVAGGALIDPNFNNYDGTEGSGSDRVVFRIALNGYEGPLVAEASVWYQSLPPRWMEEMFAESSDAIDSFKAMYQNVDPDPELIANVVLNTTTDLREQSLPEVLIYPNPVVDASFMVQCPVVLDHITVYGPSGRIVTRQPANSRSERVWLPAEAQGTYVVVLEGGGQRWVQRIVVL